MWLLRENYESIKIIRFKEVSGTMKLIPDNLQILMQTGGVQYLDMVMNVNLNYFTSRQPFVGTFTGGVVDFRMFLAFNTKEASSEHKVLSSDTLAFTGS